MASSSSLRSWPCSNTAAFSNDDLGKIRALFCCSLPRKLLSFIINIKYGIYTIIREIEPIEYCAYLRTLWRDYHRIRQMEGDALNHEDILAVLPDSRDDAKSLKEIAQAMGLDTSSYINWIRVERRLSSSLRSLARWGSVASDRRQGNEGPKFWYNAYWRTDLTK